MSKQNKKLDLIYYCSDLKTHLLANSHLISELIARGHNVKTVISSHSAKTDNITKNFPEKSIVLAERLSTKVEGCLSILLLHGISLYKINYNRKTKDKYDRILVPTKPWIEERNKKLDDEKENFHYSDHYSDGWNKLDCYYDYIQRKQSVKDYIYKKYKFDKSKKLIVYAPTFSRTGSESLKKWKEQGLDPNSYQNHGTGHLKDKVCSIAKQYANIYSIIHPCNYRNDETEDRMKIMAVADMFIGDISSMTLEFSVMDKPMILLKKEEENRIPGDFNIFHDTQKELLDFGPTVDLKNLAATIKSSFVNDSYRDRRNELKDKYTGIFDGNCAKREADTIEKICAEWEKG